MLTEFSFFLRKTPFLRLLLPFVAGIILQYNLDFSHYKAFIVFIALALVLLLLPVKTIVEYQLRQLKGILLHLILISLGILLTYFNSENHQPSWYGNKYKSGDLVTVVIEEPPVEKNKSFKAEATITSVFTNDSVFQSGGKVILYFDKHSMTNKIGYGTTILFSKELQPILFAGNPGAFNFQEYAAMQGLYHQVFLKHGDFAIAETRKTSFVKSWIYDTRKFVLGILKKYIPGETEKGLAEALLIGYRDDLDKTLVQAYSNTGVVHIIAISGLHLGLIYALLLLLFKPIEKKSYARWLKPIAIISILWAFSLLSGASSSVLRSAVMFTAITLAESLNKRSSVYNSIAASAFLLLVYNPYYLWDVGFQLSYAAVISILIFYKPINNWFFFSNKLFEKFWQLNAVTLAAQIFTLPLVLYYFHQFPTLFLFANLVAVPLSSLILLGEILLCALAFIPFIAKLLGQLLNICLRIMNEFIERIDHVSFSVIRNIQITLPETLLLFAVLICFAFWIMHKFKPALKAGFFFLLGFSFAHTFISIAFKNQQKLIVYNVSKRQAVDFLQADKYQFWGDETITESDSIQNSLLSVARLQFRVQSKSHELLDSSNNHLFAFGRKVIAIVDNRNTLPIEPIKADIVILSKSPATDILTLAKFFSSAIFVADASNSLWKIQEWKRQAEQLHLRFHSVPGQGAFILDANPAGSYTVKRD